MDFKKKFDHNDINNFLPDNVTVCTSGYFQKKLGEKMPTYICDIHKVDQNMTMKKKKTCTYTRK